MAGFFDFLRGYTGKLAAEHPIDKADIPEVEGVIRAVAPLARRYWAKKLDRALDYVIERLQTYGTSLGREEVDVVFAGGKEALEREVETLLATLEERMQCALGDAEAATVEQAAEKLILNGALAAGALITLGSPRDTLMARRDLTLVLSGKVAAQQRAAIREALGQYLTSSDVREAVRVGPSRSLAGLGENPEARERLAAWRASIRRPLGSAWTTWGPVTVDAWAYRWHNIGRLIGGEARGVVRWVTQNPLDERTSSFCRWVHGRTIYTSKIRRRLDEYYGAVDRGEVDRLRNLWSLNSNRTPETQFSNLFSSVGLPPYHFRCRTVIVPA